MELTSTAADRFLPSGAEKNQPVYKLTVIQVKNQNMTK